tara:strand:+ start:388 stop:825 length:438 start_codon:yes stop_codon:yes gene_type:complete
MKLFNYNISRRHLAKTFTWRFFATCDTVIIGYIVTGSFVSGLQIGIYEIFTKMFLYYLHERLWYKSRFKNPKIRHILKTFSWRFIGTIDTIIISFFVTGNLLFGAKIGIIETITKMILYYLHEKLWYRVNYGLDKNRKLVKKIFG